MRRVVTLLVAALCVSWSLAPAVRAQEVVAPTTTAPPATTAPPTTVAPTTTVPPTTTAPPTTTKAPPTTTASTTTVPGATTTSTPGAEPTATTIAPTVDAQPLNQSVFSSEQIAELLAMQANYDELIGEESVILAQYELRQIEVEQLAADVAELDAEIVSTEKDVKVAVAKVALLKRDQVAAEKKQAETVAELAFHRVRLKEQAISAFVGGGPTSTQGVEAALDAKSPSAASAAIIYASVVIEDQQELIARIEVLEIQAEELVASIAKNKKSAAAAEEKVKQLEDSLRSQRTTVEERRVLVEQERGQLETRLTEIRATKSEYDKRLLVLERESVSIAGVLATAQRGQAAAANLPKFRVPIDPTVVSSTFGARIHPIFKTVRNHAGIDIKAGFGEPIRSIGDGVVVMAELRNGYGNTIIVDHGDGIASLYAHQSAFEVSPGQVVRRGQLIGRVGSTGYSTGPHLHLEIRVNGMSVDPIRSVVDTSPIECVVLTSSLHPLDRALLADRPDCVDPATTTTLNPSGAARKVDK